MNGILTQAEGDMLMGQGNQDARGQAVNQGILGAAEGILTAPDLMSGLGRGFGGFNRGYNASMTANRPKVTPLADGAFSQVTMPDGSTKIVGNAQVADFLSNKWKLQNDMKQQNLLLGGVIGAQRNAAQSDVKAGAEAQPLLNSVNTSLDTFDRALKLVTAQADPNTPGAFWEPVPGFKIPKAQVQGMSPGLAGFFGGDQVAANKLLQGLKVDQTLLNAALTKGAISNVEMELFASPIPSLTDDREKVWKPYLASRIPVIKKLKQFQEQQVAAGAVAGTGATVTGNPNTSRPPSAAPAPRSGPPVLNNANPPQINSDSEYDALPSGAQFVGPDGQIRQKP